MIMYIVATGRQPFADRAHDQDLALSICNGIRPEITEKETPKCYIGLVKKCWDPNPDNRPNTEAIERMIRSFQFSNDDEIKSFEKDWKIGEQFEEAYKYKKANISSIKNNQTTLHPEAMYTSRLLNPYTKNLPKYDNIDNKTTEFTK